MKGTEGTKPDEGLHTVYIGVGSNVGDRVDNCRKAVETLAASDGCLVDAQASLYETEPVGLEDQAWFVNSVVRIKTRLDPESLRVKLAGIEQAVGRRPGGVRFGPRVLDLDILVFDDVVLRTAHIEVPHPRLHERRFVLAPFCDLDPEFVHPVLGVTIRTLLSDLRDGGKKVTLLS